MVLDASALIAMINGARGAAKVAGAIAEAKVSAIGYAEVVGHFVQAGMAGQEVGAMLDPLPLPVVSVDKALATLAGQLQGPATSTELSLGDRFCLALAKRDGLPVWTSDVQSRRSQRPSGSRSW